MFGHAQAILNVQTASEAANEEHDDLHSKIPFAGLCLTSCGHCWSFIG